MGVALGFAAFFLATFCAIVGMLVYLSAGHAVDFSLSYKRVGLPVGLVVGVSALSYLGVQWTRRMVNKGRRG